MKHKVIRIGNIALVKEKIILARLEGKYMYVTTPIGVTDIVYDNEKDAEVAFLQLINQMDVDEGQEDAMVMNENFAVIYGSSVYMKDKIMGFYLKGRSVVFEQMNGRMSTVNYISEEAAEEAFLDFYQQLKKQ